MSLSSFGFTVHPTATMRSSVSIFAHLCAKV